MMCINMLELKYANYQSKPQTSIEVQLKSVADERISFSNVDVLELLPLYRLSFINKPNLPLAPPPSPIEESFAH
jgi:hypothetical protein